MLKSILVVFTLLIMSIGFNFYLTTSLAQTAEPLAQSASEDEAVRIYSNLSLLSISDRKEFYTGLAPELKGELWKVQLRSYLSKHPDLTDKQRQAIETVIAFLKPQVFEISQDNPEWDEKVDKPIQNLTKRILEVFPREVAREFLTVLGGSESPISLNLRSTKLRSINSVYGINDSGCNKTREEIIPLLAKKKSEIQPTSFVKISANSKAKNCNCSNKKPITVSLTENCDCSTRSDWCPYGMECYAESCNIRQWCGSFLIYICNGLCILDPCTCE